MARIRVSRVIDAAPTEVWRSLEDISSHVTWMADAEEIRFLTSRQAGPGTRFECDTRVGPFRLTDVMEITRWRPGRAMGVRHVGAVTGVGRFTLKRARGGRTRLRWQERLLFPWWLGGPVGAAVGSEVLRLLWRGNLRRFAGRVEHAR